MATASSLRGRGQFNAFDSVAASATDSVLVAAQVRQKIRVHRVLFNHGDTTASPVTFNSKGAAAGTPITPALKGIPNGLHILQSEAAGLFETNSGEALTVTTGAGSTTGIIVVCEVVPGAAV